MSHLSQSLIGIHIHTKSSTLDKIKDTIQIMKKFGGNIIQIFPPPILNYNADKNMQLKSIIQSTKIKCVVHSSYTINLSKTWDHRSWWIEQLVSEIKFANEIGAFAIIVHLGRGLKLAIEESINNMYTSLVHILLTTADCPVKILLETSAGQGTEMCYKLDDLSHIFAKFSTHPNVNVSKKIGLCVDTCHVMAAGYDLSKDKSFVKYFSDFDKLIGLHHIKLIHLNDSKKEVGSRLDRHATIGKGAIGKTKILKIAELFSQMSVPLILETPYVSILSDLQIVTNHLGKYPNH